jgi:hypothetical protein
VRRGVDIPASFLKGGLMSAKIDICNLALGLIGKDTIQSLTATNEAARKCNQVYEIAKRSLLRKHDWGFANKTVPLSLIADETIPGWDFLYTYPTDAVLIRKILNEGSANTDLGADWIETITPDSLVKAIATNQEFAYAKYSANIDDTEMFDYAFVEAFSALIASMIAFPLTGDIKISQQMYAYYKEKLADATVSNKNEQKPPKNDNSSYVDVRF